MSNWYSILVLLALTKSATVNQLNYQITPLNHNPGLYYERLQDVRLIRAHWRLVIYIDLGKFLDRKPDIQAALRKGFQQCGALDRRECEAMVHSDYLEEQLQNSDTFTNCKNYLDTWMIQEMFSNPYRTYLSVKRSVPFGFIGSASRALFGTLNADDANYYDQEIDKLYEDQHRIAQPIANQTHLVASDLHSLHDRLDHLDQGIKKTEAQVDFLWNLTSQTRSAIDHLGYSQAVTRWIFSMEHSIQEYTESLKTLITSINFLELGTLNPEILSIQQLSDLASKIHTSLPGYEFSVPPDRSSLAELPKILKPRVAYINRKIITELNIPLLDHTSFSFYRMHLCPTPQKYGPTNQGSAHVTPSAPYLGLSENQEHYFVTDHEYLSTCQQLKFHQICECNQPIHIFGAKPLCESSLLIRPNAAALQLCDIRFHFTHNTQWTWMETLNGWLFSVAEQETLQIMCKGQRAAPLTLTGAGVLQLKPGCSGRNVHTILTGAEYFGSIENYFYIPPISLNISELSPNVAAYHELLNIHPSATSQGPSSTKHRIRNDNGITLTDIERRVTEIGLHEREQKHQRTLTYASFAIHAGFGLILLILLGAPLRTMIQRLRQQQPDRTMRHHNEDPIYTPPIRPQDQDSQLRQLPHQGVATP